MIRVRMGFDKNRSDTNRDCSARQHGGKFTLPAA